MTIYHGDFIKADGTHSDTYIVDDELSEEEIEENLEWLGRGR